MIKHINKLRKHSFTIVVIMIVLTQLISKIPNTNQIVEIDTIKVILGMTTAVLSLIFMIISSFNAKKKLDVNDEVSNLKIKIIKIALLIGIIGAGLFSILYIGYIII